MWTDMSEIVRPTRDGIHGREYINTSVDIGRKHDHLAFGDGGLSVPPPPLLEVPIPVIFDAIPEPWHRGPVVTAAIKAATHLGTLSVVPSERIPAGLSAPQERIVPWLADGARAAANASLDAAAMVMVPDGPKVSQVRSALKERNADRIVAIRMPATPEAAQRILELARDGAEVICLVFDRWGREKAPAHPRHARDVLREVHTALVQDGTRDQLTVIASGGIALAEHMAKAVICGADLVAIDLPLLVAMECRLCGECGRDGVCPIALDEIEPEFAVQRIVYLMGAWHLQLVEMLGAMGIREVRRLRGETGRCMFFEDLERESFGELFGKRKEEASVS